MEMSQRRIFRCGQEAGLRCSLEIFMSRIGGGWFFHESNILVCCGQVRVDAIVWIWEKNGKYAFKSFVGLYLRGWSKFPSEEIWEMLTPFKHGFLTLGNNVRNDSHYGSTEARRGPLQTGLACAKGQKSQFIITGSLILVLFSMCPPSLNDGSSFYLAKEIFL